MSKAGGDWWHTTINEFMEQPEEWTPPVNFWEDLVATFKPAAEAKEAFLVRARAILVHNQ